MFDRDMYAIISYSQYTHECVIADTSIYMNFHIIDTWKCSYPSIYMHATLNTHPWPRQSIRHYCNFSKSSFSTPNNFSISFPSTVISFDSWPVTSATRLYRWSALVPQLPISRGKREPLESQLTISIEQLKVLISRSDAVSFFLPEMENLSQ